MQPRFINKLAWAKTETIIQATVVIKSNIMLNDLKSFEKFSIEKDLNTKSFIK